MTCRTAFFESAPWICLRVFAGVMVFLATLHAQPANEFQVKAVFLYNFAQFVEWPARAFATPQSPLVIGVLGEDPFGAYLDEAIVGETVNQRPLTIQRYRRVDEIETCHVLFISRSETRRLEQILTRLKDRNILTVGDSEAFAARGGIIQFISENNKIRFRINLSAAQAVDLVISSKVLRTADVITPVVSR